MTRYDELQAQLRTAPRTWLITGVAGFIGFNLANTLLELGQTVIGLDNFETGEMERIEALRRTARTTGAFEFTEGDIRELELCLRLSREADYILHEAALISVAESMSDPHKYNDVNVTGFLNICTAAERAGVKRVVLASSCAVYGDTQPVTKKERSELAPISPYGLTKALDEQYGALFGRSYGLSVLSLRYFNAYGPGQRPGGAYGAVIPRWIDALMEQEQCIIFGDGLTSRDYCHVQDLVQANLLAACAPISQNSPTVFNIGSGDRVSLLELHEAIINEADGLVPPLMSRSPAFQAPRPGDIRHVGADISLAEDVLGFVPQYPLARGIRDTLDWRLSVESGAQAAGTAAPS